MCNFASVSYIFKKSSSKVLVLPPAFDEVYNIVIFESITKIHLKPLTQLTSAKKCLKD